MSRPPFRVFVSSTALAMPDYLRAVSAACRELGMEVITPGPPAGRSWDACVDEALQRVDQANVYLGVFAHRYGHRPDEGSRSLAEREYLRAVERRGLPRLIYLVREDYPWSPLDVDKGTGADRLQELKTRLRKEREVEEFTTPEDLGEKVLQCLRRFGEPGAASVPSGAEVPGYLPGDELGAAADLSGLLNRLARLVRARDDLQYEVHCVRLVTERLPELPHLALVCLRRAAEIVIREAYVALVQQPPGTQPLDSLVDRMKGEKLGDDRMPEREAGFSQAIIGLGNVGAHPKKQPVSMADVAQGLQMLEPLLQWYLRMAPAPEKGAGGKPAKEKAPRPEPTAESEGTARVPGKKPEKDKGAPKKPLEKPSAAEAPEKPRPTVPPAAPAALTVSFLLSYSTDGQAWQALAAGGRAPRGSRLRALVQAEVGCHLLLLIETLDAQGQAVELQAFGPGAADLPRAGAGATAVRQVGLWESLPPGRVLLERQMERAAAWRVGLLAQAAPPDELLRRLAEPGDRAAAVRQALAGLPEPAVRPVALPLVTRVGFGLNAGASARRLEGPQPWAYWSEVRFA